MLLLDAIYGALHNGVQVSPCTAELLRAALDIIKLSEHLSWSGYVKDL